MLWRAIWTPLRGPVRFPAKGGDGGDQPGYGPGGEDEQVANREPRLAGGVTQSGGDGVDERLGGKVTGDG